MTFKFLFSFVFLAIACSSIAQELAKDKPIKRVEFRIMSWSGNLEGFNYESEKKRYDIDTIGPISRTRPYTYVGNEDLIFFSFNQGPTSQVEKTPLLKVPYDSLIKRFLILVNDTSKPYTFRILDESGDQFGPGSFRVVNFSRRPIKYLIGLNTGDIKSAGIHDENSVSAAPGDVLPIKFATPFDETLKIIYSNRWLYDNTERVMIFLIEDNNPDNNGFMTKFFSERYFPPAEDGGDIKPPTAR
jgi:hypothetical protein